MLIKQALHCITVSCEEYEQYGEDPDPKTAQGKTSKYQIDL